MNQRASSLCVESHSLRETKRTCKKISRNRSLALLCLGLLTACSTKPDIAYFTDANSGGRQHWVVERRIDEPSKPRDIRTRFVVTEFAESGTAKVPQQTKDALEEIRRFKPKTVLLYIHGWRNDSSFRHGEIKGKDMNDLDGFLHEMVAARDGTGRTTANQVPGLVAKEESNGLGKVLGIYVAWRGERVDSDWLDVFSLNPTRRACRRFGQSDGLKDFLGDVASTGRSVKANVVFAGHSLGAAVLEKAAANMIEEAQPVGSAESDVSRLPHLFILANSAEVAEVSETQIDRINGSELVKHRSSGLKLTTPLVISATGSKDRANLILQPLNNYVLHPYTLLHALKHGFTESLGFSKSAQTHMAADTRQKLPASEVPQETWTKLQMELAARARLEPAFWVPTNKNGDGRLSKYRLIPTSGGAGISGLWNFLVPGGLVGGHNDVYNPRFLSSCISFFHLVNDHSPDQPEDLPAILRELKKEIQSYPPSSGQANDDPHRLKRTNLVMGAALRMPYNEKALDCLLNELSGIQPPKDTSHGLNYYAVNLFAILKYTHNAQQIWDHSPALLKKLAALMDRDDLRRALGATGDAKTDGSHETDKNLKAFYKFLRKHDIRTP